MYQGEVLEFQGLEGLGSGVLGSGVRGFRAYSIVCRVWGSGFRV